MKPEDWQLNANGAPVVSFLTGFATASINADTLGLLRHSTFVLPGSIPLARREHLQIIQAIRDGEARRAEMLARRHVRRALAMRLQLQKQKT